MSCCQTCEVLSTTLLQPYSAQFISDPSELASSEVSRFKSKSSNHPTHLWGVKSNQSPKPNSSKNHNQEAKCWFGRACSISSEGSKGTMWSNKQIRVKISVGICDVVSGRPWFGFEPTRRTDERIAIFGSECSRWLVCCESIANTGTQDDNGGAYIIVGKSNKSL